MKLYGITFALFAPLLLISVPTHAVEPGAPEGQESTEDTVVYPASFFDSYKPVSARDMVEQVPGFQIDDGDDSRGFSGAGGNVLINGERPSSKQDSVSSILERIPASRVERLELIRGNTGKYDAGDQTMVVNVLVDSSGRAWTWSGTLEQDTDSGGPTPSGSLSVVDRYGNTTWRAGISASTSYVGNTAQEALLIAGTASEDRDEFERNRNQRIQLNASSDSEFGKTTLRLNGEVVYRKADFFERSRRAPIQNPGASFNLNQRSDDTELEIELGGDVEFFLSPSWQAKLIALHRSKIIDDDTRELLIVAPLPASLRRRSIRDTSERETIGRFEIDVKAGVDHLLEFDIETALNSLDNALVLRVGDGGVLVPIDVPGANNRVEELRGELEIRDTWQLGTFSLESAMAAELSRISQTGAGAPDQEFFFLKPSLTLIHAPDKRTLNRVRFSREIAQLDFGDFISSANFFDDDIDRGNPGLNPQQTWAAEISAERRFSDIGVAKLGAFHNWVRDVQDRLPIDDRFEVSGNIGNGRRWGLTAEATIALETIGIRDARIDLEARWEDSSVIDPVTGENRRFSGQRRYKLESELRQDRVAAGWAWGVKTEYEDRAVEFELDEIDIDKRGLDIETFIETTRFFGVKIQLTVQNLLDRRFLRDRSVFNGPRGSSETAFRELRDLRRGRSVLLSVGGAF